IASAGELRTVERAASTVTLAEIEIPPARAADAAGRDAAEKEFLRWRSEEMPVRFAKGQERLRPSPSPSDQESAPRIVEVWPNKPPDEPGTIGAERERMSPTLSRDKVEVTQPTRLITDVTRPTLTIYRPAASTDTGTSMLIFPGGGYWDLYWELEGEEVARWLTAHGITGIILKYRVPRRPDESKSEPARRPLQDAQRAIRLVRQHAREWELQPNRIGVIGFSAGGHLALATATQFDRPSYAALDATDEISCRPDFAVAAYSGFLKSKDSLELAPWMRVPANVPPVFLVHGSRDPISPPSHSVAMYLALQQSGNPVELHVYASTTHDFGVRGSDRPYGQWTDACERWLNDQQLLTRPPVRP
ncbi:MAG: alpha/beta hydrolase, partial [Planctomycetaceae bacterium]